MPRILLFTTQPGDWQRFLADPEKHWRTGHSARTLAHCWEATDGFPPEVAAIFGGAAQPSLRDVEPVLAIPEFKVPLPGGDRASQNDLFVLAKSAGGAVSIMVEGKVNESFGPTIEEWLVDASTGKQERLRFLLRTLGLSSQPGPEIRYQLLHRAASALLEAERFHACAAVMLVHSFSDRRTGWSDFQAFAGMFGLSVEVGVLARLGTPAGMPIWAGWVQGDVRFTQA